MDPVGGAQGLCEIPGGLEPVPGVRAAAERSFEPDGRVRRDAGAGVDDRGQMAAADAQVPGGGRHREPKGLETVVADREAGVRRILHRHEILLLEDGQEGPFVHCARELAKGLPKDAVVSIESFGGDTIHGYQSADGTLRECTGMSEEDEQGEKVLDVIRRGLMDVADRLRVKREGDEEKYRRWILDELSRTSEETERRYDELKDRLGLHPVVASEPDASENASE